MKISANQVSEDKMKTFSDGVAVNCFKYISGQNGYINTNGEFVEAADSGWSTSSLIDVSRYNTVRYKLRVEGNPGVVAYDAYMNVIAKAEASTIVRQIISGDMDITEASYLRFNFFKDDELDDSIMGCTLYNRSAITHETASFAHVAHKPYSFSGKYAVYCGSSITKGFTDGNPDHITENGFPKLFSDAVGMTFENKGVGGASIARVSGYACIQDQINSISDWDSIDFLFLEAGINDWQLGVTIADYKAALKSIFDTLVSNFTGEVIVLSPINNAGWNPVGTPVADLEVYGTATKEVALQYDYCVLNGALFDFPTKESSAENISALFGDKLHPTELGYKLYANAMRTALC